jgi:hypothetical protein
VHLQKGNITKLVEYSELLRELCVQSNSSDQKNLIKLKLPSQKAYFTRHLHIYKTSISKKHSKAPTTVKDFFIYKTFFTENHSGMVLIGAEAITRFTQIHSTTAAMVASSNPTSLTF